MNVTSEVVFASTASMRESRQIATLDPAGIFGCGLDFDAALCGLSGVSTVSSVEGSVDSSVATVELGSLTMGAAIAATGGTTGGATGGGFLHDEASSAALCFPRVPYFDGASVLNGR